MTATPKNVVVLLLDSLNRHEMGAYGGTNFDTPNLDRLAARSVRFTNHHTGSLHVFLHATTFWLVPGISSGSRGVLLNCGKNQLLLRCAVPE